MRSQKYKIIICLEQNKMANKQNELEYYDLFANRKLDGVSLNNSDAIIESFVEGAIGGYNIPVNVPVNTPPANVPVNTPPANVPVNAPPANVPVNTPPVNVPVNTPPANVPVNTTARVPSTTPANTTARVPSTTPANTTENRDTVIMNMTNQNINQTNLVKTQRNMIHNKNFDYSTDVQDPQSREYVLSLNEARNKDAIEIRDQQTSIFALGAVAGISLIVIGILISAESE